MANIQFLENVIHNGVVIPKGAIVSDIEHELSKLVQDLIDRGLVQVTDKPTTHTTFAVGVDQFALPHSKSSQGTTPTGQAQIEQDNANGIGQQAMNSTPVTPQVNNPSAQPTAAEVAATAAQVK